MGDFWHEEQFGEHEKLPHSSLAYHRPSTDVVDSTTFDYTHYTQPQSHDSTSDPSAAWQLFDSSRLQFDCDESSQAYRQGQEEFHPQFPMHHSFIYGQTTQYTQQETYWQTSSAAFDPAFPRADGPPDFSSSTASHYAPLPLSTFNLPPPWAPPYSEMLAQPGTNRPRASSNRSLDSFDSFTSEITSAGDGSFYFDIDSLDNEAADPWRAELSSVAQSTHAVADGGLLGKLYSDHHRPREARGYVDSSTSFSLASLGATADFILDGGDISQGAPKLYERIWRDDDEVETSWSSEWQGIEAQVGEHRAEAADEEGRVDQLYDLEHDLGREDGHQKRQSEEGGLTGNQQADSRPASTPPSPRRLIPNTLGLIIPRYAIAPSEGSVSASNLPLFTPVRRGAPPLSFIPVSPSTSFSSQSSTMSPVQQRPISQLMPAVIAAPASVPATVPATRARALFQDFVATNDVFEESGQPFQLDPKLTPPAFTWDATLDAWLGYRRNYAALSATIRLPPPGSSLYASPSRIDSDRICHFTATFTAFTLPTRIDVPMQQLDSTRKAERATPLLPASFLLSTSRTATNSGAYARASFSRVQFSNSTANHPSGCSSVQGMTPRFAMLVVIEAALVDGRTSMEIGRWESEPVIVRGRSPKNFGVVAEKDPPAVSPSSSKSRRRSKSDPHAGGADSDDYGWTPKKRTRSSKR